MKDRPCAVILVTATDEGGEMVTVLPVTHTPPADASLALEIPSVVKQRLGLDGERSWIVFAEANRFVWPGPDLARFPADVPTIAYGVLPPKFFELLKVRLLQAVRTRRMRNIARTD